MLSEPVLTYPPSELPPGNDKNHDNRLLRLGIGLQAFSSGEGAYNIADRLISQPLIEDIFLDQNLLLTKIGFQKL